MLTPHTRLRPGGLSVPLSSARPALAPPTRLLALASGGGRRGIQTSTRRFPRLQGPKPWACPADTFAMRAGGVVDGHSSDEATHATHRRAAQAYASNVYSRRACTRWYLPPAFLYELAKPCTHRVGNATAAITYDHARARGASARASCRRHSFRRGRLTTPRCCRASSPRARVAETLLSRARGQAVLGGGPKLLRIGTTRGRPPSSENATYFPGLTAQPRALCNEST